MTELYHREGFGHAWEKTPGATSMTEPDAPHIAGGNLAQDPGVFQDIVTVLPCDGTVTFAVQPVMPSVYITSLEYLNPTEDCTPREAVLLGILMANGTSPGMLNVDYAGYVAKHNLGRHFSPEAP